MMTRAEPARLCDRCGKALAASQTTASCPHCRASILAAVRKLPEAKPLRAAALYYSGARAKGGTNAATTADAEENLYRQALALAVAMLGAGIVA